MLPNFGSNSNYICGVESQRVTLPSKGSPLSNLSKNVFASGLTPLSDGHRELTGLSTSFYIK